jgi:uncharacterized membrane protein YhaH (DUF805 family)
MDFGTAVKTCFNKYTNFLGQAIRSEHWFFTFLLSIMIIINISKKEMLQNYKKIIFLLFSLIPILIWKITCINYNINNDIINYVFY